MIPTPLLIVGGGNMGGALAKGWRASGLPGPAIHILDPSASGMDDCPLHRSLGGIPADFKPAIILIAVKPQMIDEILPPLAERFGRGKPLWISIAAGKPIGALKKLLGGKARIVRAMPNTPALVGKGMSVCVAGKSVTDNDRAHVGALMRAVGDVAWLEDEKLMHAVTALSGSGPAYVFALIEALAAAGVQGGLSPELANQLAVQTVAGAGALAAESGQPAAVLRRNVTSKGGTTEAGLLVWQHEKRGVGPLIGRTIRAAMTQSKKLGRK